MATIVEKGTREQVVHIPADDFSLEGNLNIPERVRGVVLFAHGSGSSRFSPRNRFVAETLQSNGLATLLMDLLSSEEEAVDLRTGHLRFDIDLLAERLLAATEWLTGHPDTKDLTLGYFGSSTGAAAALVAAARVPEKVGAVVSRGGRADLAGQSLPRVQAPTLLIVGGRDTMVIDLNREAMEKLKCEKKLEIIPWATHLFEEPGALEDVAKLAGGWFAEHLTPAGRSRR